MKKTIYPINYPLDRNNKFIKQAGIIITGISAVFAVQAGEKTWASMQSRTVAPAPVIHDDIFKSWNECIENASDLSHKGQVEFQSYANAQCGPLVR